MNRVYKVFIALALAGTASLAMAQDKVVYHFDSGIAQATKGLRNMRNHLDKRESTTRISSLSAFAAPPQLGVR